MDSATDTDVVKKSLDPAITSSLITGGFNLLPGIVSGIVAATQSKSNFNAQKNQLIYNRNLLQEQQRGLKTDYENSLTDLTTQRDQAISGANYNIGITSRQQSEQAQLAAVANITTQGLLYEQLQAIQEEGISGVGSATAAVAGSGFRASAGTSSSGVIAQTAEAASRNYENQKTQVDLSAFQMFYEASNNYFSANAQIESYKQTIRNTKTNFKNQYKSLTDSYNTQNNLLTAQIENYQGQIDEMGDWNVLIGIRDFFSALF